ncbi:MAG: DUF3566 domain-containing protein [Elusimicrobiota bacterium]
MEKMEYEISRLNAVSALKVGTITCVIIGIVFGLLAGGFIGTIVAPKMSAKMNEMKKIAGEDSCCKKVMENQDFPPAKIAKIGVVPALLAGMIIGTIAGIIGGILFGIGAVIYNIIAGLVGGIKTELK